MLIIFGTMCCLGAAQVFLSFSETGGESLEEIELLFAGKIKPWNTKPGHSKLDEMIDQARNKHFNHKFGEHEHVEVVGDEKV